MRVKSLTPHVWTGDPALHWGETDEEKAAAKAGYKRFVETGDTSHLRLKDGARPTVWKLRSLPMLAYEDAIALVAAHSKRGLREAARRGIVSVENLTAHGGGKVDLRTEKDDGIPTVTVACLVELFDEVPHLTDILDELGMRVLEVSNLNPTSGRA